MSKFIRLAAIGFFALLLGAGLASPAQADVDIRSGKAADLPIRSANPSNGEIERSYAAMWNPNVALAPKYAVSVRGNTPKVQTSIQKAMSMSKTMDFFSIKGRVTGKTINGNSMTVTGNGVMAGYPAQSFTYYYVREGGIWKYDWKANCRPGCQGNPDWGY
ncbi:MULTISPECIES: hypothetical protein [unclassified Gordonia (in: high G+C Gram-positive bacteria)]|uniref:hypothetical protein n=1 Tax=unclassified Gordonia (in: high G+C Gram-positive bacteria) TaxID=2657482 RepID=UPI001F0F9052|nr:hypothetical protein [Gordonia sp. ABSL49_1]MCH5643098.1 hypothetical protein [Gordonia sp. ABSL49_1]